MKKIYMLMMALGVTMMLSAAQVATMEATKNLQRANVAKAVKTETLAEPSGLKAPAAGYDDCDYYFIPGMMYAGLDEDWYGFSGILVTPGVQNMYFQNIFGNTQWTWGGDIVSTTDKMDIVIAKDVMFNSFSDEGKISGFLLPSTSDHKFESKEEGTLSIKGYTYAEQLASQMMCVAPAYSEENHMMLTLCERYTNSVYNSENQGQDMYIVGAGSRGKYAFGSKLNVAQEGQKEKYPDAIVQYVTVNGTLFINRIVCPIYSEADEAKVFPAGVELTATIYPAVDGQVNRDSVIAKSTITNEGLHGFESKTGSLIFEFYEVDEFGLESKVPVIVDGDIVIEYEGLNKCDFGFLSDYYCPVGSTYFRIGDDYDQFWSAPANLTISFDGYFPSVINDTTVNVMYGEIEGGEVFYSLTDESEMNDGWNTFWTNVNPESWYYEVIYDENGGEGWLTIVGFDDSYYESNHAIFTKLYIGEADASSVTPFKNEGYDREATIRFIADGATYEIIVKQAGELGPLGVENVFSGVKADKTIVNGQLLIKKGEKTFNAMGQEIK